VFRFIANVIVSAGALMLLAQPLQACVSEGSKRPVNCVDEISGKNCSCLVIRNDCTYTITMRYSIIGGVGRSSLPIGSGKTNTQACTTKRTQSVQYLGWDRR
jgi:hypothetical protein